MIRLNVFLLLAVVICSLGVVTSQHKARQLFQALDVEQERARQLEGEFGHLQLVVADGQAWWDRAVAAGCKVIAPYERQFWGDDWGLLEDPFGLKWAILQPGAQA